MYTIIHVMCVCVFLHVRFYVYVYVHCSVFQSGRIGMSSSEVDGDDGTSVPLAERAVSQDASDSESVVQHRRDVRRCGPARVFLFLATLSGWWANFLNDSSMPLEPGQTILVGAAIASWTFSVMAMPQHIRMLSFFVVLLAELVATSQDL
jgi:hypothetical protein